MYKMHDSAIQRSNPVISVIAARIVFDNTRRSMGFWMIWSMIGAGGRYGLPVVWRLGVPDACLGIYIFPWA